MSRFFYLQRVECSEIGIFEESLCALISVELGMRNNGSKLEIIVCVKFLACHFEVTV